MTTAANGKRFATVDLLKVLLTVGIVFRHSELPSMTGISEGYDLFSKGMMLLTELCVPLFFVLSGFLYFRNVPERPGLRFFLDKDRKRVFSLLIPYIIANVVAFLCYWAAYRFAPSMMSGFFGDDWQKPLFIFWTGPVNMSLWFIRDLIIAVIFAPLTWLIVRYTRIWGVLALGLLWYFAGMQPWYNFFFTLGAWAATWRIDVGDACRRTGPWWLLLYACSFMAAMKDPGLMQLSVLCGLPLCIYVAGALMRRFQWQIPLSWQAWCFFIYLYHYILVIALKKSLCAWLQPSSGWMLAAILAASAVITLALLSAAYILMRKLLPRTTGIITGEK